MIPIWTLTGFSDEIGPELELQLDTLESEGVKHLELRAVWDTNVLALSDDQISKVQTTLKERGFAVSAIGSPIGKIAITDDFAPHKEQFARAIRCAQTLDTRYIRIFSFFIPAGESKRYRTEVIDRLKVLAEMAEEADVVLLHENEKDIYGDIPERCLDIVESVASPHLRLVWDPANFVQVGVTEPHTVGYDMLRPHLEYIHVKDALATTGENVPAGEGDGQIRETIAALKQSGFEGFFSMEPHLKVAGTYSGFSGPELFKTATQAFKRLLEEADVPWN